MTTMPLAGLSVVQLASGIAGGYATKLLADAGADVVMIEPPTGDPLRRWTASGRTLPADIDGPLFRFLAAGKRSLVADANDVGDIAAVLDQVRRADAAIWSAGPLVDGCASLAPHALRAAAPDTTIVALSAFGLDGPWADRAATELTVQALAGGIAHRGPAGKPPLAVGGRHGDWSLGTFGAVAALIGTYRRRLTGSGELADVSMLEALVMTPHFNAITYQSIAGSPYFIGRRPRYPGDIEPTADGWVGFALVNTLQPWLDFCALIGHPEWADDEVLHNPTLRAERYHELTPHIRAWTTAHTTAEIVEMASALRIPVAPVGNGATTPTLDHLAERRFFQASHDGQFLQPSPPFRFGSRLPDPVGPPAPSLGPSIAGAVRPTSALPAAKPAPGQAAPLPFAGLRVADLTAFWAGPFASHPLAMLGAEVVHVESTTRPDGARSIVVRSADPARWWEWSHAYQSVNTNKLGVSLDVSGEAGLAALRRIIAQCDVVIENYSPRVLDGWGLDEAGLRAIKDDLVIVRMPAFGLAGPWRDRVGFAMTMEQVSGLAWLTGRADGPPTTLLGPCDPLGAAHGTAALLMALHHRLATGEGLSVEVPMVAGAINHAAEQVIEHSAHGVLLGRDGNRGPAGAPQNLYRCADVGPGDGPGSEPRWVALAVEHDEQWHALRAGLGSPAWADDERLASHAGRRAAHDEIDRHLQAWCSERTMQEVVEALWPLGVPVAPVLTTGELIDIPQLHARTFLETVEHPVTGTSVHTTYPLRLSGGPDRWHRRAAPVFGQDTRDVLARIAGLSADEIAALDRGGAISADLTNR